MDQLDGRLRARPFQSIELKKNNLKKRSSLAIIKTLYRIKKRRSLI